MNDSAAKIFYGGKGPETRLGNQLTKPPKKKVSLAPSSGTRTPSSGMKLLNGLSKAYKDMAKNKGTTSIVIKAFLKSTTKT